ncbi:peptidase [candidate division KSB1 bacterium]|nr:peptidase [candidate division KSB1 bacterium]
MRFRLFFIAVLCLCIIVSCSNPLIKKDGANGVTPLIYEVNLNDRSDDTFKVKLYVDDLTEKNAVYQFASTAPGTYITMDMGRFVRDFQAFDKAGTVLKTEQVSTNQWRILEPEKTSVISYSIAETWDTAVDSNRIYAMCGSSIEDDHVQINGQCVFGYPTGMQARPLKIKLDYPEEWKLGTALDRDQSGYFRATNYDHVVDSPFLLGELSMSELEIGDSKIEIYTYSKTGKVQSEQIMASVDKILHAEADFMNGLPVDRYTFLFHFEDVTLGAWEHSYSSIYAYSEDDFERLLKGTLSEHMAHEFYHIVTPLNIHSEIIEQFNFVTPEPSQHLWLYEGTTEWAAQILQLRANLMDLDTYLKMLGQKLNTSDHFPQDLSLTQLAGKAFSKGYVRLHPNIYMKGAIVTGLLDIRLLELSKGQRGFREVINELAQEYGPDNSFSEENFFTDLAEMTHPEIADFFDKYVIGVESLPLEEYYGKLGIKYSPEVQDNEKAPALGYVVTVMEGKLVVASVTEEMEPFGLKQGDVVVGMNGEEVNLRNARKAYNKVRQLEVGVPYQLTVIREGEEMTLTCEKVMRYKTNKHVFKIDSEANREQLALREAWLKNM